MSRDNYNEFSGGTIDNWANLSERELVSLVAKSHEIPEEVLRKKVKEEKIRFSGDLTYWQILSIATILKRNEA